MGHFPVPPRPAKPAGSLPPRVSRAGRIVALLGAAGGLLHGQALRIELGSRFRLGLAEGQQWCVVLREKLRCTVHQSQNRDGAFSFVVEERDMELRRKICVW